MSVESSAQSSFQLAEEERCLRMFLSVDVSGSTEYKNKHSKFNDYTKHWARFYKSFFEDFPSVFTAEYYGQFKKSRRIPSVWKCLGDEIIYQDKIIDSGESNKLVSAFCEAIAAYDDELRNGKFRDSGLRVKGTCWSAGFPIRNSVLLVPTSEDKQIQDYVGPDMDIGFRLSKASRPGRVVVSMDVADILTQTNQVDPFVFHHVGWEVFKGVFGDKPYPIFWITKETQLPHLLPWEGYLCPLTLRFLQAGKTDIQELRKLITDVRKELPQMELFSPYFNLEAMPSTHQEIWEKWNSQRIKNDQINLDQGEGASAPSGS